jgi:hypothetical protein
VKQSQLNFMGNISIREPSLICLLLRISGRDLFKGGRL